MDEYLYTDEEMLEVMEDEFQEEQERQEFMAEFWELERQPTNLD